MDSLWKTLMKSPKRQKYTAASLFLSLETANHMRENFKNLTKSSRILEDFLELLLSVYSS